MPFRDEIIAFLDDYLEIGKFTDYLPIGLLPQAGVSIGLVLAAKEFVGDPTAARIMVNAVLASVIINELISPALVKVALTKAGEVKVSGEE